MKIVYLTTGLPHYFNLVLSKINAEPGIDLVVVSPSEPSSHVGAGVFLTSEGANFRSVLLQEYAIRPFIFSFKGLVSLLMKERPDVIVLPDHILRGFQFHPALMVLRYLLRFRLVLKSIPFLIPDLQASLDEVKALREQGKLRSMIEAGSRYVAVAARKRRFQMVDAHVVYVDEGKELYGSYGVPSDRIFVTRNSPDTDALKDAEQRILAEAAPVRCKRRVLFVGRLVPEKRADLLIRAFRLARGQFHDAELVIVGDGPERDSLRDLVRRCSLEHAVRFAGPIYDPVQLGKEFMASYLFVLPGLGGLSINEAMYYGLAIVCAKADGTERFLVREGVNGAFFKDGDEADLARVMIEALSDPDQLRGMGSRSKEIIEKEVNIQTVVAGYLNAFRSVCSKDR